MKVFITGTVVDTEVRTYTDRNGASQETVDVYLAPENPRYKAERFSCAPDIAPKKGEKVGYWAIVTARPGKYGPYLSVRAVERTNGAAS